MLSYEFYKVFHLIGVFMILVGLGGLSVQGLIGGVPGNWKRRLGLTHGFGMLVALIGGFGLLAKLHLMASLPGWVYGKLVIWLALGGMIALMRRKAQWATLLWWLTITLAGVAAYFAIFKPF